MANTTTAAANVVTNFLSKFFEEFVRENLFTPYTGEGHNNPIVMKRGKQIVSMPLVAELDGDGVEGNATLDGNEAVLANYAQTLTPTYIRQAIRLSKEERDKPAIDLMRAGRSALMTWGKKRVRDDIIRAFGSVNDGTNVRTVKNSTDAAYDTSADTWVGNNTDRVLFGNTIANYSAGDFSASLANIDTTNDKLTGDIVRLVRKLARSADPIISPITEGKSGIETYVLFVGSQAMLHLKEDLETLHSNSDTRGEQNALYRSGDLYWDNVVIREIPEISSVLSSSTKFATAGDSSSKVEPCFLAGAQALGYGLGEAPMLIPDPKKDYNFQPGVAVELKHDIEKLVYNSKDHGMLSLYVTGE